jgi:hypothetical protein
MSGTPNIRKEIMEHSNRHNQKGSIKKKPWNYFCRQEQAQRRKKPKRNVNEGNG